MTWDQFKANEELFGVKGTSFDESLYTTSLPGRKHTLDERARDAAGDAPKNSHGTVPSPDLVRQERRKVPPQAPARTKDGSREAKAVHVLESEHERPEGAECDVKQVPATATLREGRQDAVAETVSAVNMFLEQSQASESKPEEEVQRSSSTRIEAIAIVATDSSLEGGVDLVGDHLPQVNPSTHPRAVQGTPAPFHYIGHHGQPQHHPQAYCSSAGGVPGGHVAGHSPLLHSSLPQLSLAPSALPPTSSPVPPAALLHPFPHLLTGGLVQLSPGASPHHTQHTHHAAQHGPLPMASLFAPALAPPLTHFPPAGVSDLQVDVNRLNGQGAALRNIQQQRRQQQYCAPCLQEVSTQDDSVATPATMDLRLRSTLHRRNDVSDANLCQPVYSRKAMDSVKGPGAALRSNGKQPSSSGREDTLSPAQKRRTDKVLGRGKIMTAAKNNEKKAVQSNRNVENYDVTGAPRTQVVGVAKNIEKEAVQINRSAENNDVTEVSRAQGATAVSNCVTGGLPAKGSRRRTRQAQRKQSAVAGDPSDQEAEERAVGSSTPTQMDLTGMGRQTTGSEDLPGEQEEQSESSYIESISPKRSQVQIEPDRATTDLSAARSSNESECAMELVETSSHFESPWPLSQGLLTEVHIGDILCPVQICIGEINCPLILPEPAPVIVDDEKPTQDGDGVRHGVSSSMASHQSGCHSESGAFGGSTEVLMETASECSMRAEDAQGVVIKVPQESMKNQSERTIGDEQDSSVPSRKKNASRDKRATHKKPGRGIGDATQRGMAAPGPNGAAKRRNRRHSKTSSSRRGDPVNKHPGPPSAKPQWIETRLNRVPPVA